MEPYIDSFKRLIQNKKTTYVVAVMLIVIAIYIAITGYTLLTDSRSSSQTTQHNETFDQNNSIVGALPYKTPFYSISYDRNGSDPVTIKIFTISPYYRYQAVRYLTQHDQEVTVNHRIVFVDYKSPLGTGDSK